MMPRTLRRAGVTAALVLPAAVFLLVFLLYPLWGILGAAVIDPASGLLPQTHAALRDWPGDAPPADAAAKALLADLRTLQADGRIGDLGRTLNDKLPGFRSLITRGQAVARGTDPGMAALVQADPRWGEVQYWQVLRQAGERYTDRYLLAALDLERDAAGRIADVPAQSAVFRVTFWRTFVISLGVTLLCLVLGFPCAWLLTTVRPRTRDALMLMLMLPFWTSLLVRTAAWIVLLQQDGVVNRALIWLGLTAAPLHLVYNRFGVYVAMTHILLPFMILPLYAVLQGIPARLPQAAASLGAGPLMVWRTVMVPLALPGTAAGCLLVFILATGYYITPSLVGGPTDQLVSALIAFYAAGTGNWGMAAALSAVLLVVTLVLYAAYARLTATKAG
jgi:putative spermidine/putrescine transport system permease protein